MNTRLARLEAMLEDDPRDQFLRYALALEFDKLNRSEESLAALAELTQDATPYVPAYFMAGQQLARRGQIDSARAMLRAGIEAARQVGNTHAAGEMSELLSSLGRLGDQSGEG